MSQRHLLGSQARLVIFDFLGPEVKQFYHSLDLLLGACCVMTLSPNSPHGSGVRSGSNTPGPFTHSEILGVLTKASSSLYLHKL